MQEEWHLKDPESKFMDESCNAKECCCVASLPKEPIICFLTVELGQRIWQVHCCLFYYQTCLLVISMCTYSYSAVVRERSTDHVEWAVNESMAWKNKGVACGWNSFHHKSPKILPAFCCFTQNYCQQHYSTSGMYLLLQTGQIGVFPGPILVLKPYVWHPIWTLKYTNYNVIFNSYNMINLICTWSFV